MARSSTGLARETDGQQNTYPVVGNHWERHPK